MSRADAVWSTVIVVLAVWGLRAGVLQMLGPLLGVIGAVEVARRAAPRLLAATDRSEAFPELLLAFLVVVVIAGYGLGGRLARAVRARLGSVVGGVDRLLGGVVGAGLGIVVAWLGTAYLAQESPETRAFGRDSEIGTRLLERFPPADVLTALHRFDELPVVSVVVPERAAPPPTAGAVPPAVLSTAARSVVQVTVEPCGLPGAGTGWVAGRDVVATNAHVVAGDPEPGVRTADGRKLAATVTVFDRVDDIAVLAVPGLDLPSLALGAPPRFGAPVAILGHPGGGPLEAAPATVGDRGEGLRPDPVTARRLPGRWLNVRGHAEPGSSGSPILNRNGRVVAMVWGGAEGAASIAAVPTADIRAALLATRRTAPQRCSP